MQKSLCGQKGMKYSMNEKLRNSFSGGCNDKHDAVCIHTDKIYDSCKDKDCIEDARVYFTAQGQEIIDRAVNVKCRKSEIIWVFSDVEPVPFNRGYFTVDLKFFFKITLDAFTGVGKPCKVEGLASFDKKVILFGSEGSAKVFESRYSYDSFDEQLWQKTNMPKAVVEVVDPLCLAAKVVDMNDKLCHCCEELDFSRIPQCVCNVFEDALVLGGERKRVFVSIGLFSIVKIERSVQLLIPAYDFCVPQKECVASSDDSPCELFEQIEFPFDEFFPPEKDDCKFENLADYRKGCCN